MDNKKFTLLVIKAIGASILIIAEFVALIAILYGG